MYWAFESSVTYWRRQMVQAELITPPSRPRSAADCGYGFRAPMQPDPYGVNLWLTYRVNPRHPHPDNYLESFGFLLFSERLVQLLAAFGVQHEAFPVTIVDRHDRVLPLRYSVFHLLNGAVEALDYEASGWQDDGSRSVARIALNEQRTEERPLFLLKPLYVRLMRDDLRQAIRRQGITGFRFLDPGRYRSGSYGLPPEYTD